MTTLTAPTINSVSMNSWFYERWDSQMRWIPPDTIRDGVRNGQGEPVVAGYWTLEWTWSKLHPSWWRWWTVDVLAGAWSVTCDMTIWSPNGIHNDELVTYSDVIVQRPLDVPMAEGKYHQNVTVRIEHITMASLPSTQYWTVGLSWVGSGHVISS